MDIIISEHAKERIKTYNLTEKIIIEALNKKLAEYGLRIKDFLKYHHHPDIISKEILI